MKCAMCNRPLSLPTVAIPTREGPMAYGPKCAKRAGIKQERAQTVRIKHAHAFPDVRQADWVQQAQQGAKSGQGAVFFDGVVHG